MTPREGFKYGFLLRCAEEGLTVKQAAARAARGLEKRGDGFLDKMLGSLGGGIGSGLAGIGPAVTGGATDFLKAAPGYALGGLGLGMLGAGGIGYGLGKMQEGDISPEEIQREELISAYKAQTDLARRRAIMEAALRAQPRPRSRHGI